MYLIDTNVVSEARKRDKANPGVIGFFERVHAAGDLLYVSVITVGEIRRGIELIRHRGDTRQARQLESWLAHLLREFVIGVIGVKSLLLTFILRKGSKLYS